MGDRIPQNNKELVEAIRRQTGYLGLSEFDPRALAALERLDRARFAPEGTSRIYDDEPLKIGFEQTCSQPSMVAAMATLLELGPGMKLLEIGTGCGYSAAATSELIMPGGELCTVEIIPELTASAKKNIIRSGAGGNIRFFTGDGSMGLPAEAPFDRIYFTAGAGDAFDEKPLLRQLRAGGILLYPEAQGRMFLVRKTESGLERRSLGSVGFVVLRGKNSGFD